MDNVYRFYFTKIAWEKTAPRGKKYVKMEARRCRHDVGTKSTNDVGMKSTKKEAKGRSYELDGGAGESH